MTDPGYENLLQMYGELYPYSDYKRSERIRYYAAEDGSRAVKSYGYKNLGPRLVGINYEHSMSSLLINRLTRLIL
jgi:hypothetical protein